MTQEVNFQAELKSERDKVVDVLYSGFVLVKKTYILLVVLFMMFQLAVQVGVGAYYFKKFNDMFASLNERVTTIETTQVDKHRTLDTQEQFNQIFFAELQFNLQVLMEKQGLNYKRFQLPETKK